MESVKTLLDKAAVMCGQKRVLAHRLGCSEQNLQALFRGTRHLTPRETSALANILDVNALELLGQVTIEREKDPVEKGRLMESFFRRGIAGATVICLIFGVGGDAEAASKPYYENSQSLLTNHCQHLRRRFLAWLAAGFAPWLTPKPS